MTAFRERGNESYVTLELSCGHSPRIARAARPPNLRETVLCMTCVRAGVDGRMARRTVDKILPDEEWVIRCFDCNFARRFGKKGMTDAMRHAGKHSSFRGHVVRAFHEKDPSGTEILYRGNRTTTREEITSGARTNRPGIPDEPTF